MNTAYLILGGNLGNRTANLAIACTLLSASGVQIESYSSIYETEPWQMDTDLPFLNQCIKIMIQDSAENLLQKCLEVEKKMGRIRKFEYYESRVIDIDILFFNGEIIINETITIPHPRLHLRKFVLMPLAELCPDVIHPVLRLSVAELLASCNDNSSVKLFTEI